MKTCFGICLFSSDCSPLTPLLHAGWTAAEVARPPPPAAPVSMYNAAAAAGSM